MSSRPGGDAEPRHGWIGSPVDQLEFDRLLRGAGTFVADLRPGATLHAAFVRSTVAAGRVANVDAAEARRSPGVVAVLTGAELAEETVPMAPMSRPQERFKEELHVEVFPRHVRCLAVDAVTYVGEPLAVVVAADRYLAEDAAGLVVVDIDPTDAVVDAEFALRPDATRVHAESRDNVAVSLRYEKGDVDEALARDDVIVVEGAYTIGRQTAVSVECRGVLAAPGDDGRTEVWSSTQAPLLVKRVIAEVTGWDPESVRVRSPDVGGGFGPKVAVYGEEVVVAFLARRLGRSVTWVEDRYENLVSAAQARDQVHRSRLVVDRGGQLVAWDDDFTVDVGVHNPWMVGVVANTALHLLGPYRIPSVRVRGTAAYTNKTPTSQYRGAGRPEACFALERSLDEASRRLGMEAWKVREVNILGAGDLPYEQGLPYRDGVDVVYDGRDYASVLTAARDLVPEEAVAELERLRDESSRIGFGMAAYMEATARGPTEPESARIALTPGGRLVARAATGASGQAHETMLTQVAAETARVRPDRVDVVTGDTDDSSIGSGTFASRTAVLVGSALHRATLALVAQARLAVAEVLRVDGAEHVDGGFAARDGEPVTWAEVAAWFEPGGPLAGRTPPAAYESFAPPTVTWTMGVHVVALSVDVDTGAVRVLRYGVAHEGGRAINPRVVDGQIRGGVAQGIGGALFEEVRYDASGQPVTATLADYLVPGAGEVPPVRLAHQEVHSELNPLGARGVGESGIIASGAAIASAIDDALAEFGVRVDRTPMTSEYLLARLPDRA
ncbi:MAG: molybdopterin-dependent oxidoreductase [Streptosporangiales bacterium]|nr:molybdopterin-dependent oxidoreductase [Streptosporangiales bacterium]